MGHATEVLVFCNSPSRPSLVVEHAGQDGLIRAGLRGQQFRLAPHFDFGYCVVIFVRLTLSENKAITVNKKLPRKENRCSKVVALIAFLQKIRVIWSWPFCFNVN
jgi:hypothetical protein